MMLHTDQPEILKIPISGENGEFVQTSSISSEETNGSTDRSSESPSNVDDLMEDEVTIEKVEEEEETLVTRVTGLEAKIDYIQHQLTSIMNTLHAPLCTCFPCAKIHKNGEKKQENTDASVMLSALFPNASTQQLKTLLDLSKMNKLPSQVGKAVIPESINKAEKSEDLKLGQLYNSVNGGGKIQTERLSERKIQKKFQQPPVASFYQRKDSGNLIIPPAQLSTIPSVRTPTTATSGPVPTAPTVIPPVPSTTTQNTSPGPSSTDGEDHLETPGDVTTVTTPTAPNLFTQSMVDMLKLNAQNAAHSTGSPGFLRGRGRGRPKLIGDELDADLVDYMVSLKNSDPHGGHFTASQALHMARQYILERAPGLLEEHGGHVKLKLTWAMKLVSRIGERQKEIEFGLPAGTLSNMGRNLTNLPGGNFMADVMAQNIFSQHMMMVNQMNSKDSGVKKEEVNGNVNGFHQNEENLNVKQEAPNLAEIVNIKELNIPFLNNFLAELNEKNQAATVIDGEIGSSSHLFQA